MKNRQLGKTNLMVSEIGFGCRSIGGNIQNEVNTVFSNITEQDANELVRNAVNLGVNVFDTSDSYSSGESEIRLGNAVEDFREDVHIFTKGGTEYLNQQKTKSKTNLSFDYLTESLDVSLNRMKTDYVDLFQTHGIPENNDMDQIAKTFDKMKSENKARFCGVSIGNAISRGLEVIEYDFIDCIQLSFSMINKDALDELIPKCFKKNIGIIVNRPLAEGFLGNFKIRNEFSENDFRSKYTKEKTETIKKKISRIDFLKELELPLSEIAISYIVNNKMISTCIPSSNSIKQLVSNVNATKNKLDKIIIEKINQS